jgi:hypothetical protein
VVAGAVGVTSSSPPFELFDVSFVAGGLVRVVGGGGGGEVGRGAVVRGTVGLGSVGCVGPGGSVWHGMTLPSPSKQIVWPSAGGAMRAPKATKLVVPTSAAAIRLRVAPALCARRRCE